MALWLTNAGASANTKLFGFSLPCFGLVVLEEVLEVVLVTEALVKRVIAEDPVVLAVEVVVVFVVIAGVQLPLLLLALLLLLVQVLLQQCVWLLWQLLWLLCLPLLWLLLPLVRLAVAVAVLYPAWEQVSTM